MVPNHGPNLCGTYSPSAGANGAAALKDLPNLLTALAPEGAPALAVEPNRAPQVFAPFPLPLTKPAAPIRQAWLPTLLGQVNVEGRPLHPEAVRMLAKMLGGPERADGLPGWHPRDAFTRSRRTGAWVGGWAWPSEADGARARAAGRVDVMHNGTVRIETYTVRSTTRKRDDRSWGRAVWAAAAADLAGASLADVSRLLELGEHVQPDHGQRRLRGAERHRAKGRALLALLGAWPWAHVADGRLEKTWRDEPHFTEALRDWHERACEERAAELRRCRLVANYL